MIISAIVAMDRTGIIGDGVKMPWHLPLDLRRFKKLTMGKPLIMGRRTFQSLHAPLPGRLNIVVTRDAAFAHDGCRIAGSVEEAMNIAGDYLTETGGDEVMIIGGGLIYDATAALWNRLFLTVVEGQHGGNTHFPLDRIKKMRWKLVEREFHDADARNALVHWFLRLDRLPAAGSDSEVFDFDAWLSDPGTR